MIQPVVKDSHLSVYISAHPDDMALAMFGCFLKYDKSKHPSALVIVTDGSADSSEYSWDRGRGRISDYDDSMENLYQYKSLSALHFQKFHSQKLASIRVSTALSEAIKAGFDYAFCLGFPDDSLSGGDLKEWITSDVVFLVRKIIVEDNAVSDVAGFHTHASSTVAKNQADRYGFAEHPDHIVSGEVSDFAAERLVKMGLACNNTIAVTYHRVYEDCDPISGYTISAERYSKSLAYDWKSFVRKHQEFPFLQAVDFLKNIHRDPDAAGYDDRYYKDRLIKRCI